ncbi:GTP 3',8-cyclase MoaA [Acinetobacter tianfuensis]|uniref:GTP 3',8-cyclase n=1 Tax=Acinetobacter tianfuensis TaxID=2419603 RepID=A0A3A8EMM6_9GAMM|nr:GTP 3',8-cyclase MoaA [Acinetobacter tianfuensis]RKG31224.1 GTP 3',8-cyclase MoaA [Acinetobacter tianfuensis]
MNSMTQLQPVTIYKDQFGREKRKLRISVTDRCNFKCVYCMPEHPEWMKKHNLLSFEALYSFCEFMVQRGIEQIRITGGEPLMRQGVVHFIEQLQPLKKNGLKRISMTTNGHYLKQYAKVLKQAGLDDLNISLDSLDEAQFFQLTQKQLKSVLEGIDAAKNAGFSIKINAVLMKGVNDQQIIPLTYWAQQQCFELRFIEFMPLDGDQNWTKDSVVTEQEILTTLKTVFEVNILHGQGASPARSYEVNGLPIGIISTISNSFCGSCDRLRLNAQGEFFNCLFAKKGLDLGKDIRSLKSTLSKNENPLDVLNMQNKLGSYIWHKEQGFHTITATSNSNTRKISMHMIGG